MNKQRSLGWRLGISGAFVAAAASALLGLYLYETFENQLLQRDDVQLLGKLRQLRQLLSYSGTAELLRSQADYVRDTMSGESNALIEIDDVSVKPATPILRINPVNLAFPVLTPVPLHEEAVRQNIRHWQTKQGIPAATVTAIASLGAKPVEIRLTRIYSERDTLLRTYRLQILITSLVAGMLSGAVLMLVIWRGLAPLRVLRTQTTAVSPQNLSQRLDRSQVPGELLPLVGSLNEMLQRLETGYLQLHQFSADLAHELRTPLAALTTQTQVTLSKLRNTDEYEALLESHLEAFDRLNRLVDSLLFLARNEHQQIASSLVRHPVHIGDEFSRIADYFEDLAAQRQLRIVFSGDAEICADKQMLRRMLANLVSNAVRYAVSDTLVELSVRPDGTDPSQYVILDVSNQSDLLAKADLERLFDRFYRADASRHSDNGGSGLGLAIVKAIATLHGGSASVSQSHGGKITFSLRLPVSHS